MVPAKMGSPVPSSSRTPLLPKRTSSPDTRATASNVHEDPSSTCSPDRSTEPDHTISPAVLKRLYISHFLSTWNSRVFEFGAVLYLASIYPGTLLPMSVYALSRQASAVVLSPSIGRFIDRNDRLKVVRLSIVLQRIAVAISCCLFWLLLSDWSSVQSSRVMLLAALAMLACVGKLCAIMNLVSVERDWVVVITENHQEARRGVNAQMRRIDLICKLAGPLFISLLDGVSTEMAILVNLGMNMASVLIEYFAIARVYHTVPALQQPKTSPTAPETHGTTSGTNPLRKIRTAFRTSAHSLQTYFTHRAFLPSFAGCLLYLTVLSFSGQMVTFLLSSGFSSMHIATARTVSVAFELSATWIAPRVMNRIGPIRAGIWFVMWQGCSLLVGASAFWAYTKQGKPLFSAAYLVAGVISSRIGMWGFDLSAQVIIQEEVESSLRGAFSSMEASWQNFFELCSYASTIIWARPEQFQWPVLVSCIAVHCAGGLYALFVRRRRGHLLHFSKCMEVRPGRNVRRAQAEGYERVVRSGV